MLTFEPLVQRERMFKGKRLANRYVFPRISLAAPVFVSPNVSITTNFQDGQVPSKSRALLRDVLWNDPGRTVLAFDKGVSLGIVHETLGGGIDVQPAAGPIRDVSVMA